MALVRISFVTFTLAALVGACTDSELDGEPRIDRDGLLDTGEHDTGADTQADTTPDTSPFVCTSDESCRAVLTLGPCDVPVCTLENGSCSAHRRDACCASDADCPALGAPCLVNTCPQPGGSCVVVDTCTCRSDNDCLSTDPCFIGRCAAGACQFDPNPACAGCQTNEQCNDGARCTSDVCVDGRCVNESIPGCCNVDGDCVDDDPCTIDFCRPQSGICGYETLPDCGTCTPESCNDGDPCTTDICSDLGCVSFPDPQNPDCPRCQKDAECDDGNVCTRDVCDAGQCVSFPDATIPECACGGSSCDDGDVCTLDSCDGTTCQHVSVPEIPGCGGRCESDQQCPPPDACSKSYCDAQLGRCVLVSAPDCCTSVNDCDDGARCTEDTCLADGRCRHDTIPGCDVCQLDCDDGDICTFDRCAPDLASCAHDRIPGCTHCPQGCDDGDRCTADRCDEAVGACAHDAIPDCVPGECRTDAECADATDCTRDFCGADGLCGHEGIFGCCRSADDCDDGNRCTEDSCQRGPGLCVNDAIDCDDGNPCTFDSCDPTQGCVSVPNPTSPDCQCVPELLWARSFVDGEEPDLEIDGSGFGVRWRVDGVRAFSPTQSLRYGDDTGEDYSTGFRTYGRATGPTLSVAQAAGEVRLDFMVFLDIDADPAADSFRARVLYDNQNQIAWDRVELDPGLFGQWYPVSVALPAEVIGNDIRIRFVFDSLSGDGNLGQGVFVDDIAVYTTCP